MPHLAAFDVAQHFLAMTEAYLSSVALSCSGGALCFPAFSAPSGFVSPRASAKVSASQSRMTISGASRAATASTV